MERQTFSEDTVKKVAIAPSAVTFTQLYATITSRKGGVPSSNTTPGVERLYAKVEIKQVLAQPGSRYTIQIGATANRQFLRRFVTNLPADNVAALFKHRINRANRVEFLLTYGSFASRQKARLALEGLSSSTRRYGAFVRSFQSIQNDIRKLPPEKTAESQPGNLDSVVGQ